VATIAIGLGAVVLAAVLVLLGEKGPEYAFTKFGIVTTVLIVAGFTANHARRKQNAAEDRKGRCGPKASHSPLQWEKPGVQRKRARPFGFVD